VTPGARAVQGLLRLGQIGFDWLCCFAQSSFAAQKRGKLALFGAFAPRGGATPIARISRREQRPRGRPDRPMGTSGLPPPASGLHTNWLCFSSQPSFSGQKREKLALFCTNDDSAPSCPGSGNGHGAAGPERGRRIPCSELVLSPLSRPRFRIEHFVFRTWHVVLAPMS
jgi:hypothetical protein